MTKDTLTQYIHACELAASTEKDLKILRKRKEVAQDSVKGSNPVFPYEPKTFHVEGMPYARYMREDQITKMEKLLENQRKTAAEIQVEVQQWMNSLPKTEQRIRRIITMKYIEGMTWHQVSARLGASSPDAARKELKRFLKKYH